MYMVMRSVSDHYGHIVGFRGRITLDAAHSPATGAPGVRSDGEQREGFSSRSSLTRSRTGHESRETLSGNTRNHLPDRSGPSDLTAPSGIGEKPVAKPGALP
jgi:hypothetical protein